MAVIGAIVASGAGGTVGAELTSAGVPAWWTLTAFGGAVLVFGLIATGGRAKRSARRTATAINPEALAE